MAIKTTKKASAGVRKKRRSRTPLLSTDVTVTAKKVTGADVDCDFSGVVVTDNALFVSYMVDTDITFTLVDQTGKNVAFDTNNPFGSQNNKCPKEGASPKRPCSVGTPRATANRFTMCIEPTYARAVSYYRLNFANGLSCDPIIIHE